MSADEERREAAQTPLRKSSSHLALGAMGAVPVFFDFPEIGGTHVIEPRWGHAAATLGERLYVYGGLAAGDRALSDIHFFSISESHRLTLDQAANRNCMSTAHICGLKCNHKEHGHHRNYWSLDWSH